MPEAMDNSGSESAEKAYAAAAESAVAKADAVASERPAPLEFPAKPKRASAVDTAPKAVAAQIAVPVTALPAELEADLVMPPKPPVVKQPVKVAAPAPAAAKKPVIAKKPVTAKKRIAAKRAASAKKTVVAKPIKPAVAAKPVVTKPVKTATPKIKPVSKSNPILKFPVLKIKEAIMATKQTNDFTKTVKSAAADVQAKAKLALAKGSAIYGEASAFTKGNVDALVTSGKILGAGLQDLGKTYAAEGKSAYETVTADVKELAAVKSPVDFIRIQTSIVRRNFDHAFDFGGRNSEAVLKLASEAFAPLSARASLAVEKVKKAA